MALLGDDGLGYDLARKLESCGVWRNWLGDGLYSTFHNYLSSPSSWEAFMRTDDSKSRAQIQLQLRARALLYDKSACTLFLPSLAIRNNTSASSSSLVNLSKINPNYLQLHGDDVYYTLEGRVEDELMRAGAFNAKLYKNQLKSSFRHGSRSSDLEACNMPPKMSDELPETWYSQYIEKRGVNYRISIGDRDCDKRTPEEMSAYLNQHKRRRLVFQDDQFHGVMNSVPEVRSGNPPNAALVRSNLEDDVPFHPETMFIFNTVPDSALPPVTRAPNKVAVELYGILDTLPQPSTRSPGMIERPRIMPEFLTHEQGGVTLHGKRVKRCITEEQALQLSKKVVARALIKIGFEGATEVPLEAFSQLLSKRICKLGKVLKLLADSYRMQCSSTELLKMFLQATGYSNLGNLLELVRDGMRGFAQPNQQPGHMLQSSSNSQHQVPLRISQQIPRHMHAQMQQIIHPQTQQQHLERLRRRSAISPRPNADVDKEKTLVQVKLENTELPMEVNALNPMNARNLQIQQFRQQQLGAMSGFNHPAAHFRQMASMQMPQMQAPNMSTMVKQELMGGDTTRKHESEDSKLTSPAF